MIKRSVVVQGHATSVRLEPEFWHEIDAYCKKNNISFAKLIISLETKQHTKTNLSSLLRVFCLNNALDTNKKEEEKLTYTTVTKMSHE